MGMKEYEMKLRITREMYYNEENMFGIYACVPVHYTKEIKMNTYGNFSLQGQTRRLKAGEEYVIKFNGTHPNPNPNFDDFYKIVEVPAETLDTVEDQDKFLQAIITENQFNSLKEAYPTPNLLVDLILEDGIDTNKTKGIKSKSLAKIKEQVQKNANISVLIAKLNTLNLSTRVVGKILAHFKTSEAAIDAIEEDIYNLCRVSQLGFLTVDKSALARGDNPTNSNRIFACFKYILEQDNSSGHSWSHISHVLDEASRLLNISDSIIEEKLKESISTNIFYGDASRIALMHTRKQERLVCEHLWRLHSSYTSPSKTRVEGRIAQIEEEQGFKFTDEQRNAIINSSQDGVSIINGSGGTGKSTIMKGLISALGNESYTGAALSGKASNVLSKSGIEASTIHRMLGYDGKEFKHSKKEPLPYDIVIVDEASMVNISLFLSILSAMEDGCKIVIVGDSGQLPNIGFGDLLYDMISTKVFPVYELTQVHRQASKSGILELANRIRNGEQVVTYNSSGKETYGELEDQTIFSYSEDEKSNIPFDVLRIAQGYKENVKTPEDLFDFQIFVTNRTSGNLSVLSMNTELQGIFNGGKKPYLSRNNYNFKKDDKIIATGNSYKLKSFPSTEEYYSFVEELKLLDVEDREKAMKGDVDVYNGTMGIVKHVDVDGKVLFIQFEETEELIAYKLNDLDSIHLAYAISIHRGQGSGIKNIIVAVDFSSYLLLSRQLIYTGITRAIEKGLLLVENNALYTALQRDANTRQTFLKEFLLESEKENGVKFS